ncbi:MAG: CHAT domain-containing protein [Deltaproteobacteria bacterium]|nr:CHAT domain-containing protein [Deltaproteobacteria bacterium]
MWSCGNLDFRGLDLLTLSASGSAPGAGGGEGREAESLGGAAQRAGASAALATLMPATDISGPELMREFCRLRCLEKRDNAGALRGRCSKSRAAAPGAGREGGPRPGGNEARPWAPQAGQRLGAPSAKPRGGRAGASPARSAELRSWLRETGGEQRHPAAAQRPARLPGGRAGLRLGKPVGPRARPASARICPRPKFIRNLSKKFQGFILDADVGPPHGAALEGPKSRLRLEAPEHALDPRQAQPRPRTDTAGEVVTGSELAGIALCFQLYRYGGEGEGTQVFFPSRRGRPQLSSGCAGHGGTGEFRSATRYVTGLAFELYRLPEQFLGPGLF